MGEKALFKGKIISLVSVIILLIISMVGVTLSWYVSNPDVYGEGATLIVAPNVEAAVQSTHVLSKYAGQTSRGYGAGAVNNEITWAAHVDSPYTARTAVTMICSQLEDDACLKIELLHLVVSSNTNPAVEEDILLESNNPAADFTFRVESTNGVIYRPNSNGILIDGGGDVFPLYNGNNTFNLIIIFMNEVNYNIWQNNNEESAAAYGEYLNAGNPNLSYKDWLATMGTQYYAYQDFTYSSEQYMFKYFFLGVSYKVRTN